MRSARSFHPHLLRRPACGMPNRRSELARSVHRRRRSLERTRCGCAHGCARGPRCGARHDPPCARDDRRQLRSPRHLQRRDIQPRRRVSCMVRRQGWNAVSWARNWPSSRYATTVSLPRGFTRGTSPTTRRSGVQSNRHDRGDLFQVTSGASVTSLRPRGWHRPSPTR